MSCVSQAQHRASGHAGEVKGQVEVPRGRMQEPTLTDHHVIPGLRKAVRGSTGRGQSELAWNSGLEARRVFEKCE